MLKIRNVFILDCTFRLDGRFGGADVNYIAIYLFCWRLFLPEYRYNLGDGAHLFSAKNVYTCIYTARIVCRCTGNTAVHTREPLNAYDMNPNNT